VNLWLPYLQWTLGGLVALAAVAGLLQWLVRKRTRRLAAEVAERKRTEAAMLAERQRLLDVLETLPVIVVLLRPDHRVEWVNRAYRAALGDNVGKLCYSSQFACDKPCEECQAFTPLETGRPHNWQWTLPNGRTFDIYNFPFADTDGSTLILEMDIDITERRQAEAALKELNENLELRVTERTEALRASEERLRTLGAATFEGIVISENGLAIEANEQAARMFGYSLGEVLGKPLLDFLMPKELQRAREILKDEADHSDEYSCRRKDGSEIMVEARGHVTQWKQKRVRITAMRDITDRKRAEAQIQRQMQELAQANEELSQFNRAMVGRELRMIELKQEINALCAAAGQPARYRSETGEQAPEAPHGDV
jgi:PAS domain S-box-containing protein